MTARATAFLFRFHFLFLLLAGTLGPLSAASPTYQRTENFSGEKAPDNWRRFHKNQFYGFSTTTFTGGQNEAGGLFQPKTYFNSYADPYLNGALPRGTPLRASGRLSLRRISARPPYTDTVYVAHFRRADHGFLNVVGLALTGFNAENVTAAAILQFSSGAAFLGNAIGLPVGADTDVVDWSYAWDPSGGTNGFGALTVTLGGPRGGRFGVSTLDLDSATVGLGFDLDTFGWFQPPFLAPNSNTFLEAYLGRLHYTSLLGRAPKLRIDGPRTITTTTSPLVLTGTSRMTRGNRVKAIRYRVVQNGRPGRYRTARGTTDWTATVQVPAGASRIDVRAIGDNGLDRTVTRDVRRQP